MSDTLLNKMDALLKKHRELDVPTPAPEPTPQVATPSVAVEPPPMPADAWLPVLTEVVEIEEPVEPELIEQAEIAQESTEKTAQSVGVGSVEIETVMTQMEQRLSGLIRDTVAKEIRENLDQSMAEMFIQLDSHIREILRESLLRERSGK